MYYPANPYTRNHLPIRQQENKLRLIGEGMVTVQPDLAIVLLGVVTESPNLQQAQETNAEQATNVINALLEQGIPRENIQTEDYRVDMNYDFKNGTQIFRGYRVTNLLNVTIEDINRVGQIVDIAVDKGANTVRNIMLTVKNKERYYTNALQNAIRNAQEKSQAVGETLGVTVDQIPFNIKELGTRPPEEPRPFVLGVSTEQAATTPIEAGQMKITATIEAYFRY